MFEGNVPFEGPPFRQVRAPCPLDALLELTEGRVFSSISLRSRIRASRRGASPPDSTVSKSQFRSLGSLPRFRSLRQCPTRAPLVQPVPLCVMVWFLFAAADRATTPTYIDLTYRLPVKHWGAWVVVVSPRTGSPRSTLNAAHPAPLAASCAVCFVSVRSSCPKQRLFRVSWK